MDSRRILITGANGFVGRHLIRRLLDTGGPGLTIFAGVRPAELAAIQRSNPAAGWTGQPDGRVTVLPLDILDAAGTDASMSRVSPTHLVHLAARSSGADTDRDEVFRVNVEGTRNVLESASNVAPFPRALVVSTGYVYGDTAPSRPAREVDPIGPLWRFGPYTDSKIEMEGVTRNYRAFAIVARAFAHTGPGQISSFAVPGFARQLARIERGEEPPVLRVGNLSAVRDILDVRDVAAAYDALITSGAPGEVYNVASAAPLEIGDLLDRMRHMCRIKTSIEIDPTRLRPAEIACSTGDPLKLRYAAGWSPVITLDATLRDTMDYWRASPD